MQGDQIFILLEDMVPEDQHVMQMLAGKVKDHMKLTEDLAPQFVLMGSFGRDPDDVYAWFEGVETKTPYHFKFRKETSGQAFVDMLEVQRNKSTSEFTGEEIVIEKEEQINND